VDIHSSLQDGPGGRSSMAVPVSGVDNELEPGKRTPFSWPVFAVKNDGDHDPARLEWKDDRPENEPAWLRLTVALEVWEDAEVEVRLTRSRRILGRLALHYCDVFEVVELALSARDAVAAQQEGVELRLAKGTGPVYLFGGAEPGGVPPVFRPHLLRVESGVDRTRRFFEQFNSLASIQQFGWKEGCVLDGLYDLHAAFPSYGFGETIERHLAQFLDDRQQLRYEDPWGRIADGRIYGIEGTLPFAVLARVHPEHPALKLMTDYYQTEGRADGALYDEGMVSAEGNYTIAYPLAVVAAQRKSRELEDKAIRQLHIRRQWLVDGEDLYLRCYEDGERKFRNWIRAYTWYMLGLVRTLHQLPHRQDVEVLKEEFVRIANIALSHQQPDGLWRVFVDDPDVIADTSGSAGIAAALSLGVRDGLLPRSILVRTNRALSGLQRYLTPDGLLGGASQANKNGEGMQRSRYRIVSQMGMGLMAQLIASEQSQRQANRIAKI
jgi:rhamnogalacturonyl hydrolase YesR